MSDRTSSKHDGTCCGNHADATPGDAAGTAADTGGCCTDGCCAGGRALGGIYAMVLLRLWLAVRAIQTGIEKFAGSTTVKRPLLDEFGNEDISGAMVEAKVKIYGWAHYHGVPEGLAGKFRDEPLLPGWALAIYDKMLGPALLLLGVTLLLGLATRTSLLLMGLLYISLTWGLILVGQDGGIAWLGTHMLLIVAALALAKYDRLAILKKW